MKLYRYADKSVVLPAGMYATYQVHAIKPDNYAILK